MKHVFVLNPAAGQGDAVKLKYELGKIAEEDGLHLAYDEKGDHRDLSSADILVYETKERHEPEEYVRSVCDEMAGSDETVRFYACGGDGTMHEVVNGAKGLKSSEIAQIPCGTGNDFVRCFRGSGDFRDIRAQMKGSVRRCDAISYSGEINGKKQTRLCMNMFNIGLDCNVVDATQKLKKFPLVKGHFAYYLGALAMLIEKKGADLKIEYDDGTVYDGKLLLVAIGNGRYCGGDVKGVPKAEVDDGRFDVSLVESIKKRDFSRLFPLYKKGTHLDDEHARRYFHYRKCKKLVITPSGGKMRLCTDGEVTDAGKIEFSIVPYAINFVIPEKM